MKMGEGEIDSNAGGILETERGGIKEKLVCCGVWTGNGPLSGRGGDGRKGRECTQRAPLAQSWRVLV